MTKTTGLAEARASLREALAAALRLGAALNAVAAVSTFAYLVHAEGQTERSLELFGLSSAQPAWSSDSQADMQNKIGAWGLEPAVVQAGLARGAKLDWEATLKELLA